jgi:hypothetical protein
VRLSLLSNIILLVKLRNSVGSHGTHDGARLATDTSLSFSVTMSFTRSTSVGGLLSVFRMCSHVSIRYAMFSTVVTLVDSLVGCQAGRWDR